MRIRNSGSQITDLANNQPFGAVSQDAPMIRALETGQALIGNIEDSVLDYIAPYASRNYTGTIDDLGTFKILDVPINSPHISGNNRTDKHIGTTNNAPYDPMIAAATYATLAQRRLLQDIRKGYGQNAKILDRLVENEYERQQISQQIRNIRGFQEALGNQFSTGIPDYLGEYAIDAMEFTNSRVEDQMLKRFQEPMKALHQAYYKLPDDSPLKIKTNDQKTFYTTAGQVLSELAIRTLLGDKKITNPQNQQKKITEQDWRNWIRSSSELLRFGVNVVLKPIRNQILADIKRPGDKNTIVSIRPKTLHKLIREKTKNLPKEQRARVLWFMSISGLAQVPEDDAQRVLSLDAIIDSLETAINVLEKEKKIKTTEGLARLVRDTFATVIGNAGHTPAYESAFRIYNAYYESRRRPELYGQQRATVTLQEIRNALKESKQDPSATRTISRNQGLLPFLSGQRNYIYITENEQQVSPLEYAEILKDLQKTKIVEEMTNLFEITGQIPISRTQEGIKINQKWENDIKKALFFIWSDGMPVVEDDDREAIKKAANQSTKKFINDLLKLKEFARDGILTTVEYGQFRSILWNLEKTAKQMPKNSQVRQTIERMSQAFERMEWLRDAANSVVPTSLQNTSVYTLYYGFSDEAIGSVTGLFNPVSRTIGMANFFRSLASHRGGVYNEIIENALQQLDPNYGDVSLASRWMYPIGHQISAVGDFADVLMNLVTRPLQQVGLAAYKHVWGGMPASVDVYPWGALYDIEPYIAHWMEDAERMGFGRSAGAFMAMQILSMADPATVGITAASTLLGPTGLGRAIGAGALGAVRGLAPAGRAVITPLRTLSTNVGRLRTRWHNTSIAQAINGKYVQISPRLQHMQRLANVSMMHGMQAVRYGYGSALLIGDLADIVDAYYMGGGDPMTILTALLLNPEYVVSPRAGLARTSILIRPAIDRISRYSSALSAAGPFLRPEVQAHFSETKSLLESISVGPSSVFEKNSTILYYDRGDNTWKVGRVERYDEATQKISAYNAENRLVEGIDLSQVMRVVPRSIANNRATIQSGLAGATLGIVDTIRNKEQRNITVTKSALLEALGDIGKQAISVLEKTGIITHDTQTDAITLTRQGQNIANALENPSESLMTYIGATIAKQIHPNNTKQQQKFIQKFTKGMSFVKPEYRSLYLMEAIVQSAHKAYGSARTVFAGILPLKGITLQYKNTTGYSPVTSELKDARTDSPRLQVEGKYSDETKTLPQDKKYITAENIALDIGENPDTISILEETLSLMLGTDVTLAGIKTDPKNKNIITSLAFELGEEKNLREINVALNQINNDIQTTSEMEQEFGVHTPEELAMIYTIANVINPLTELQQANLATERAFGNIAGYQTPETRVPLLQVAQQESYKRFVGTTPVTQRQVLELENEIQKKIRAIRNLENKVAALELELEQYRTQRKEFKREIGGKRLEKEIRKTKNEIRDLQERVKNIRQEYNNLIKQYEEYRKDVKPLYASGGYSAAYLAEPNAIPALHTAITAKVLVDTSPDLTVSWGFDTLSFLKANADAFLSSATNKQFYKNAYKLTYMKQLHKRMSRHLKQFSPEQIEQMIQESIDEWKTAPNIAFSKIIRRVTDGQYDEELLTNDTIFQSALASLNITLSGANNLEQLIGAYFTALSQDNLTLAAMYLTQLSVALNIANATAEEISRMANLSEEERRLMKEAAIQSVIVSAMSIESYLPSSPLSATTIDQQGRAVTYKEALETIKQQAIETYWQEIALLKIARLASQTRTILSEAEMQSIKMLYTSHANDILHFYEIASAKDFDAAYAWFVQESQLYEHMVGAFSKEMATDKARKFVREVMVAHHNMSNANYSTLHTDKQTLKKASRYLADQPELIEALLLPLTQYAATQYIIQEINGILVPTPQVIMVGNAIWSTAALAEETIHAMADLIAAKVLQQYAQSAEPIAADRRFAQQIPFMKALTAYYSLDLGSLRRRTEIRKEETTTPEELQALLDPIIAQERIIDVILTRKAMEDHANPFQALVAAGTWGGEKIRERIVQHAAYALRYSLRDPATIDKIGEYINDSRLYLAAKADVLRHATRLTQAYEDAVAEKAELEMNATQPLLNWTDYFVMAFLTLPRNEDERAKRRHEINSMRRSAAQDPEPRSTEAQQAQQTTTTQIVLENLDNPELNISIDGVALSILATLSYLKRKTPDLLRDRTLDKANLQTRGLVNQLVLLITNLKSGIEKERKDVFEYLKEQQDNIKQMTSFTIGLSGQKTDKIVEFYLPIHNEYYKVKMIGGNGSIRINKVTQVDIDHLRTEHAKRLVMPNTTDNLIGKLVRYENKLFVVTGIAANGDLELELIGISDDLEFERRGKTYLQINPTAFLTTNITGTDAGSSIRQNGFAIETKRRKTYVLVDPFALLLSTGELPSVPTSPEEITKTLTVPEQASTLEKQPTVLYSVLELMRTIGWSVPALKQTKNETITIAPTDEEVYTLAERGITKLSKTEALEYLDTIIDSLKQQLSVEPNKKMLEVYSSSQLENLSIDQTKQEIRKLMIKALNKISSLKDQISNLPIPDNQEIQFATTLDIIAQDTQKRLDVKYQELIAHLTQTELKDTALSTLFEKTERIRKEKGTPTQQLNIYLGPKISSTGTPKSYATNITSFLTHVIRQALNIPVQPYEIRRYIDALGITDNAIPSNIQWYETRPELRNQPEKLEDIQTKVDREIESTLIRAGLAKDQVKQIKSQLSESLSATIRSKQPVARTTPDSHLGIFGVSLLGDQAAQPTIEYLVLYAYGQPFAVGIQHASSPQRPRDRTLTSIYLLPNYDTVLQAALTTATEKAKLPTKVTVSRSSVKTVPATSGKAGTFLHDIIDKDIARIAISSQTTAYKAYAAILHTAISKGVVFFPFGDSLSLQATGLLATYESEYLPDVARAAVLSLQKFIDTLNSEIHIQSITNQINALQTQLSTITTQIAQMGTVSQERIDSLFLGLAGIINNLASQLRQTTYKDTLDNSIRKAIEEFYAKLPVTPALQSQALSVEIETYNEAISAPNPEAVTDSTQATPLSDQGEPRRIEQTPLELAHQLQQKMAYVVREIVRTKIQKIETIKDIALPEAQETQIREEKRPLVEQETQRVISQPIIATTINSILSGIETIGIAISEQAADGSPISADPLGLQMLIELRTEIIAQFLTRIRQISEIEKDTVRDAIVAEINTILQDASDDNGQKRIIEGMKIKYESDYTTKKNDALVKLLQTWIIADLNLSQDNETREQILNHLILNHLRFSGASQEGVPKSIASNLTLAALFSRSVLVPYYFMGEQMIGQQMRVRTNPEPSYKIKQDQTKDYWYTQAFGSGYSKNKVLAETNKGITIVPATEEPHLIGQGVLPNITTTTGLLSEHIHKLAIAPEAIIFDNEQYTTIDERRNEALQKRIIYYETPDYILKGDIADIILFLYLGMPYQLTHMGTITNKATNRVKNVYFLQEDTSITAKEKENALENALTELHKIFSPPNNNPIHVPPGILGKLPHDPNLHSTAKQTELGLFGNIIEYAIGLSKQTQHSNSDLWTLPQDANRTTEHAQIQEIARIIYLFERKTQQEQLEEDYRIIHGKEILETIKKYETHLNSTTNQQNIAQDRLKEDMHMLVKSLIAAAVYTVFSAAADNMHRYITAESWGADLERSLLRVLETIDPSMKPYTKAIKQIFEQYESHTPFARNGAYQVFGNTNRIITKKHIQENKYETYDEEGNAQEQNIQTIPSYATIAEETLENINDPLDPRIHSSSYYQTTREAVDPFDSSEKPYLLDMEKTDLSPANDSDRKEATIRYLHRKGGYLIREKYQDQDVIKVMRGYPAPIVSSEMRLINAYTQAEQAIEFAEKIGQIELRKGNLNNLEAIKRTALAANGFFIRKPTKKQNEQEETLKVVNTQMRYIFSELFSISPIVTRNKNIDAVPIIETIENEGTIVGRRVPGSGVIQSELRNIKYTIADLSRLATHLSSILIKKKRQTPEEPNLFELFDDAYGVGVSYTYTPTSLAGRMGAFLYTAGAAITNFKLRGMSFLAQLSRLVISLDVGTFVPILASAGIAGMAALSAYLFAQKIDQYIRAKGARIYDPIALTSGFVRTAIRGLRYIGKTIAFSMFTDNMHAILLHKLRKELAQKYRIETRNRSTLDILKDLGTTKGRYFDLTYQETANAIFELLRNYGLDPANTTHLVAHAAAAARTFGYTSVLPTTLVADDTNQDDITKFVSAIRPFAEQVIQDLEKSIQLYEKQAPLPFVWVKPSRPKQQQTQDDQIQLGEYQPNEQLLSAITRALSLLAEITYNTGNGKIQQVDNTFNLSHGIPSKLTANYGVATIYINLLFNYLQDKRLPMTNTNLTQDLITIARAILYDLESKTYADKQIPFWQALAEAAILRKHQPQEAQTEQEQQQEQEEEPQIDSTILDRAYEALHRVREVIDVVDVPKYKSELRTSDNPTEWVGIQYLNKDRNSDDERILSAIPIAFVALKNKNRYKNLDYFRAFTRALALFEATLHNSPYSVNMVRGVMVQTLMLGTQAADLAHKIDNAHIQRSYGMHTLMQIMSESSAMLAPTKPTPKATDIPFHTFYALTQIANSLQALNAMVAAVHGKLLPRGSPLGVLANVVNNYGAQLLALTAVGMLKYPQVVGSAAEYITSIPFIGPLVLGSMVFGVGLKAARQLLPPAGNLFLATRKAFSTNQLYPASEPLARSIIQGRQVLYSDIDALKQYTKRREDVNNLADEISNEDQNLIEHTIFTILQALNIYHIDTTQNNPNALQEMLSTIQQASSQQPRRTVTIKLNKRFRNHEDIEKLNGAIIADNIRNAIIEALKQYYNPLTSIPSATVGSTPGSNIIKVTTTIQDRTYEIEIMNLDELQVRYDKVNGKVEITLPAISPAKLAQQLLAITLHQMGIIRLNPNAQNTALTPTFIPAINETDTTILDQAARAINNAVQAELNNIQGQTTTADIINQVRTHFLTVKNSIAELAAYTLSDGQSKAILTNTIVSEDVATDDTPIKKIKEGLSSDLQNTRMFDLAVEMLLAITKPMAQEIERLFNTDTPVTSNYQQVGDIELQIENEHEFVARRLLEEIGSAAGGNPEPLAEAIDQHYSRDAERYYDDSIKIVAARIKQLLKYLERSEQEIENMVGTIGGMGNRPYSSLIARIRSEIAAGNLTNDQLNEIVDFIVGLITARDQMTLQTAAIIDQLRMTNNALGQRMNNLTHEDANGIYIKRILELLTLTDPEREAPSGYTFAEDGTLSQVSAARVNEDITIANNLATAIRNITSFMLEGITYAPIDPNEEVKFADVMTSIKNLMTTFTQMEVKASTQQRQMGFDPSTQSLTKHIASAMTQALGHLAEAMIARELILRNRNTQTDLSGENALQHYANAMLMRAHLEQAAYEINKALLLTDSLAENDREIVLFLRTYDRLMQNNPSQIYPIANFIRQRILHRLAERIPNIRDLTQQQINQFVPSFTTRTAADEQIFRDAITEAQAIAQITPAQLIEYQNTARTVALENEMNYRSTMAHIAHIVQEALTTSEALPNSFLSIYTMDLVRGYFDKTKTVMDDVKAIRAESPSVEFVKQVMKHKTDLIVSSLDKGTKENTRTFIEELSDTISRISSLIILVGVQAAHRARTASQAFNNTLNLYSRAPQFMNILNSLAINIFNKKLFSKRKLIKMPMATLLLTATFVLPTLLGWFVAPAINLYRPNVAAGDYKIMLAPKGGDLVVEMPDYGTKYEVPIAGIPYSLSYDLSSYILQSITTPEGYSEDTAREIGGTAQDIATRILRGYFGGPTINTNILTRLANIAISKSTDSAVRTTPSFAYFGSYPYEYPIGTFFTDVMEQIISSPEGMVPRAIYRSYTTQDPRIENLLDLQRTDRLNTLEAVLKGAAEGLGIQYRVQYFPYGATNDPMLLELRPAFSNKIIIIREPYTTYAANTINGTPYTPFTATNIGQFAIFETDTQNVLTSRYNDLGWITRSDYRSNPVLSTYNLELENYLKNKLRRFQPGRDLAREYTELLYLTRANLFGTRPDVSENPLLMQQLKIQLLEQAFNKPYEQIGLEEETMFFAARSVALATASTQIQYYNTEDTDAQTKAIRNALLLGHALQTTNILYASPVEAEAITQAMQAELDTLLRNTEAYGNILTNPIYQRLLETAEAMGTKIQINLDVSRMNTEQINKQVQTELINLLMTRREKHVAHEHGMIVFRDLTPTQIEGLNTMIRSEYQNDEFDVEIIPFRIKSERIREQKEARMGTEIQTKETTRISRGIAIIIKHKNKETGQKEVVASYAYFENVLTREKQPVSWALTPITIENAELLTSTTNYQPIRTLTNKLMENFVRDIFSKSLREYSVPQTVMWWMSQPRNKDSSDAYRLTKTLYAGLDPQSRMWATALETTIKGTEQISTMNKIINSKNNITRNVGITIITTNIQKQHTVKMIQEMIKDAQNQTNSLDASNKTRSKKYIRFLEDLLQDEKQIEMITNAANAAAKQVMKDLSEIFGVDNSTIRTQVLSTALYGAILTHYAELNGYTSIIGGKEYERDIYPSNYTVLPLHLITPTKQNTELRRKIIETYGRIEQSVTKLGGRIEPTQEQIDN